MGRKEKEVLEVKMKERLHSMKGTRNTRIAKKEEQSVRKSLEVKCGDASEVIVVETKDNIKVEEEKVNVGMFICHICGKANKTIQDLEMHRRCVHPVLAALLAKPFLCPFPFCSEAYSKYLALKVHQLTGHGYEGIVTGEFKKKKFFLCQAPVNGSLCNFLFGWTDVINKGVANHFISVHKLRSADYSPDLLRKVQI